MPIMKLQNFFRKHLNKKKRFPRAKYDASSVRRLSTTSRTSTSSSLEQYKPVVIPFQIISDEDWEKVSKLLASTSKKDLMYMCDNDQNILECICMHHPPLNIIEEVIKKVPSAGQLRNNKNQFPIHIAAKYGALPEVIQLLADKFSPALSVQDCDGRTPLHLACKYNSANYKIPICEDGLHMMRFKKEDIARSIQTIANKCPGITNLEDKDGCTALEYALQANVCLTTFKCIVRQMSF